MRFFDNAMLYKDTTQWIRSRSFAVMFMALLAFSEITCITVALIMDASQGAGEISFGILAALLCFYLLLLAFLGYNLTAREFENRTYELYELSGMSPEKMIRGKFLSLFSQFSFGFFSVVPFFFFSFYLGGLSFYIILTATGLILAFSPYFILSAILCGVMAKSRAVSVTGRTLAFLALLGGIPVIANIFVTIFVDEYSVPGYMKTAAPGIFPFLGFSAAFLCLVCMLFFYLAANAMTPSTDSREGALKAVLTLFAAFFLLFDFWIVASTGENFPPALWLVFGTMITTGFFFYIRPLKTPVMALNRKWKGRLGIFSAIGFFFRPGAAGTIRTLLLMAALCFLHDALLGLPVFEAVRAARGVIQMDPVMPVDVALAAIFHLAFPGALLLASPSLSGRIRLVRMSVFGWWMLIWVFLPALVVVYGKFETDEFFFPPVSFLKVFLWGAFDSTLPMIVTGLAGCAGLWLLLGARRAAGRRADEGLG